MAEGSTYSPGDLKRELVIERVFDAPRELVFQMWTDPAHLARWWGPKEFTNPVCEIDARVGGVLLIVMRAPFGVDFPMRGVFLEVIKPEKLVFTNIAVDSEDNAVLEGLTTVVFEAEGGTTRMILKTSVTSLVPEGARMLEGMEQGWSQSLDRLDDLLAVASY